MYRWLLALALLLTPALALAQPAPQQPIIQRIQIVGSTSNFQGIASDLTWGGTIGHAGGYVGPVMGNFISSAVLVGGQNGPNIFGVLGKYSDNRAYTCATGSPCYPRAGLMGENSGSADAAVMAIASDTTNSALSTTRALYSVEMQFYQSGSTVDFGLDLQGAGAHDDYLTLNYQKADIMLGRNQVGVAAGNNVCIRRLASAPVNGAAGTGAAVCGLGSLLIRTDTGVLYINTGTLAAPTWTVVGTQT